MKQLSVEAVKEYQSTEWIDDLFRVEQTRWKTWRSFDKEDKCLVISLTEELCTEATRFYLKGLQEGFSEEDPTYDSFVGGKL